MEGLGEHESDAALVDTAFHSLGGQLDADAEGLEDVGGAATARGGAVAVLGDAHSGSGGDKGGGGGDVEAVGAVASRADGIDHGALDADLEGELSHDSGHAGDFLGGLTLEAQGCEEGTKLGGRGLALHYLAHDSGGGVHGEGLAGYDCVYCFTNVHGWLLRLWLIERLHSKRVGQTV